MEQFRQRFHSNGKLLLTGEYLVLHGAKSLAFPLKLGQELGITDDTNQAIYWQTFEKEELIFTGLFHLRTFHIIDSTDANKAKYISNLLQAVKALNPAFLQNSTGIRAKATVEFDMAWGFGTSSTLINNLAQWAQIDSFELNQKVSKGSGYDIACANAVQPIIYQLINQQPFYKIVKFAPSFLPHLNLVYLNKKMPTEANIAGYLSKTSINQTVIEEIDQITNRIVSCECFTDFQRLILLHEGIVAKCLQEVPVKNRLFPDFEGEIKSLGAWGGDFVLTASLFPFERQKNYFEQKGYSTIFPLNDVILNKISD